MVVRRSLVSLSIDKWAREDMFLITLEIALWAHFQTALLTGLNARYVPEAEVNLGILNVGSGDCGNLN